MVSGPGAETFVFRLSFFLASQVRHKTRLKNTTPAQCVSPNKQHAALVPSLLASHSYILVPLELALRISMRHERAPSDGSGASHGEAHHNRARRESAVPALCKAKANRVPKPDRQVKGAHPKPPSRLAGRAHGASSSPRDIAKLKTSITCATSRSGGISDYVWGDVSGFGEWHHVWADDHVALRGQRHCGRHLWVEGAMKEGKRRREGEKERAAEGRG